MNSKISKYASPLFLSVALIGVVALPACSSTPNRESVGERVDDSMITTKVKAKFAADKVVSARAISVETFKGTVQLSGFADNQREIDQAAQLAYSVNGVTAVKNDIRLKTGG